MEILTKFATVTLVDGEVITPVKVETMLYSEASKAIKFGFIDTKGELVRVGGGLLDPRNMLAARVEVQNNLINEANK